MSTEMESGEWTKVITSQTFKCLTCRAVMAPWPLHCNACLIETKELQRQANEDTQKYDNQQKGR